MWSNAMGFRVHRWSWAIPKCLPGRFKASLPYPWLVIGALSWGIVVGYIIMVVDDHRPNRNSNDSKNSRVTFRSVTILNHRTISASLSHGICAIHQDFRHASPGLSIIQRCHQTTRGTAQDANLTEWRWLDRATEFVLALKEGAIAQGLEAAPWGESSIPLGVMVTALSHYYWCY